MVWNSDKRSADNMRVCIIQRGIYELIEIEIYLWEKLSLFVQSCSIRTYFTAFIIFLKSNDAHCPLNWPWLLPSDDDVTGDCARDDDVTGDDDDVSPVGLIYLVPWNRGLKKYLLLHLASSDYLCF